MRILMVVHGLMDGGGIRVALDLVRQWEAQGAPTLLFSLQRTAKRLAPHEGARVEFGDATDRRFRSVLLPVLLRLVRLSRASDVVVSAYATGPGLILGWVAARLTRKPFVVIAQASPREAANQWTAPALRRPTLWVAGRCDLAICVSPDLVPEMVALGVPAGQVTHVPNGRDVSGIRARAQEVRDTAEARSGPPVVVSVGRFAPQKGYDLLIQAHAAVVAAGLPHVLRLYGDGPDAGDLADLAARAGVGGTVDLAGWTDDVVAALAPASVFCLSSRYEGQPLVLIEAMAAGVPVIASDCGSGVRELVADGRFGELVAPESVDALAAALSRHLADPSELDARIAAARSHVDGFDRATTAATYLRLLRSLVRSSSRSVDGDGAPRPG